VRAQMSIFDPPLARATDPETSQRAADRVPGFKAKHEASIYAALRERALTYREIAKVTRLEPVAVGRRLADMERRRLIEPTGEVRGGCRVWRAMFHG
jgi:hypothetical protein